MRTDSSPCAFRRTLCARSIKSASPQSSAICALKENAFNHFPSGYHKGAPRWAYILLIATLLFFYGWLVYAASHHALPDPDHQVLFYANQTRQDIRLTFSQALKDAKRSIFLSVYGITDSGILALIGKKARENVLVSIEYDPSASSNLKKILPEAVDVRPIKTKALMHRKILILDEAQVFLGSANLTPPSLSHHSNLVLGLYHPALAHFLRHSPTPSFVFELQGQKGEFYFLPDPDQTGFAQLIARLRGARQKIVVAMFTLTHPAIAQALVDARQRGVSVAVAIDYYTAKGASKKALAALEGAGIKILHSQGKELLHHKWAVIDDEILIMGSANWTKAAFTKNHDFLFFLSPLTDRQREFLTRLWEVIAADSIPSKLQL